MTPMVPSGCNRATVFEPTLTPEPVSLDEATGSAAIVRAGGDSAGGLVDSTCEPVVCGGLVGGTAGLIVREGAAGAAIGAEGLASASCLWPDPPSNPSI